MPYVLLTQPIHPAPTGPAEDLTYGYVPARHDPAKHRPASWAELAHPPPPRVTAAPYAAPFAVARSALRPSRRYASVR